MKTTFIILLTFFLFFILDQSVYATSGCCSSHNGVDCSKVQDNGKVVCNDGNIGSSCLYANQTQCTGASTTTEETLNNTTINDDAVSKETNEYKSTVPKTIEAPSSTIEYSVIEEEMPSSSNDGIVSTYDKDTTVDKESSSIEEKVSTGDTITGLAILGCGYLGYKIYKKKKSKNN